MSQKNNNQKSSEIREIIIDDGSVTYPIKNKAGKRLGEFTFRPTDTNFLRRYNETVDFFNNFTFSENANIEDVENEIIEKLDYALNADTKKEIFSICGALTILPSGELFVEHMVNVIGKLIKKTSDVRANKMTRLMNKYVEKYVKK